MSITAAQKEILTTVAADMERDDFLSNAHDGLGDDHEPHIIETMGWIELAGHKGFYVYRSTSKGLEVLNSLEKKEEVVLEKHTSRENATKILEGIDRDVVSNFLNVRLHVHKENREVSGHFFVNGRKVADVDHE